MFTPSDSVDPYSTRGVARSLLTGQAEPTFTETAHSKGSGFGKYAGPLGGVIGALGGAFFGAPQIGAAIGSGLGTAIGAASEDDTPKAANAIGTMMQQKPITSWLTNTLGAAGG